MILKMGFCIAYCDPFVENISIKVIARGLNFVFQTHKI